MNSVRDDSVETRHWLVAELTELFEGCGVAAELVLQSVRRLYDRRLVEALDPNVKEIGMADKITIKESGVAHIELLLNSNVYVEQMALISGIGELPVRDELRKRVHSHAFIEVRDIFLKYVLRLDAVRLRIPTNPVYAQITEARRQVKSLAQTHRPPARQSLREVRTKAR
jgi:hypothetical protein